ncbi:MAG: ATP-binding cassette domain-containing protein, partial [bacterium]
VNEETILGRLWEKSAPGDVQKILEVYPKPYRPSGGEKQRILLAMAFKKIDMMLAHGGALDYEMLIFDEPTGSLDNYYRDLFLEMLFERYRKMNFTCLLITHDYSMIGKIHESHRDLMDRVAFKEVTLHTDSLRLEDFDPDTYLQWLSAQHPMSSATHATREILAIESGASVFGRSLLISRKKNGAESSPLLLNSGEMVYLKAASGVGKTTLVKLVMGLLKAEKLSAHLDDTHLTEKTPITFWQKEMWGRKMTMVFQHADEALNPESTVKGVFAGLPTISDHSDEAILQTLSELFDVDAGFLSKKVKHLSGGQKQRLNLLRGFALDTDVLILDEPLNGLDFESAGKVIAMLQRKQNAGKGILLISHNEEIFDKIVSPRNIYYLRAEVQAHMHD